MTRKEICVEVKRILDLDERKTPFPNNMPGRGWFDAFKARNPDFVERTPTTLRHKGSPSSKANTKDEPAQQN